MESCNTWTAELVETDAFPLSGSSAHQGIHPLPDGNARHNIPSYKACL